MESDSSFEIPERSLIVPKFPDKGTTSAVLELAHALQGKLRDRTEEFYELGERAKYDLALEKVILEMWRRLEKLGIVTLEAHPSSSEIHIAVQFDPRDPRYDNAVEAEWTLSGIEYFLYLLSFIRGGIGPGSIDSCIRPLFAREVYQAYLQRLEILAAVVNLKGVDLRSGESRALREAILDGIDSY